ncbi:unnamed protein product [Blepharisma stoltei]|uniref:Uncharacterized protein n=1 Tax=Blepharisma stoltei TaxID=1481888 RepID=A0AAU9KEU7_9CILI|nr:unnamed protein product [Blepharisma stoltei]
MSSVPYIGSQISLISKSDIRYEGTLHTIDPNEHTVSLSNVKSFGTEGRRGNNKEIPPSAEIYEFIIFRGSDIKDLTVIQSTAANNDPAIIKSEPIKEVQPKPVQKSNPPPQREYQSQNYAPRNSRPEAYGELHGNTNENLKEELKEDFDFQTAAIDREQKPETREKCYNKKSSFFDTISCKSAETAESRLDREKQKELDAETFGEESVEMGERDLRRYIRGGRRRGRGYRNGGGDGRGYRGGYRGENRGYRGRGEYRGESRGEYREHRGEYREHREYREYRENRGEYRGEHREYRGYRGDQRGDYRGRNRE